MHVWSRSIIRKALFYRCQATRLATLLWISPSAAAAAAKPTRQSADAVNVIKMCNMMLRLHWTYRSAPPPHPPRARQRKDP